MPEATILCLGNFDGVHMAHRALLKKALQMKDKISDASCGVLCFREPSGDFLFPTPPAHLCTLDQKINLFFDEGMDFVLLVDFLEVKDLSAQEFVEDLLIHKCHCAGVVCGFNYRFGKGGKATTEDLQALMRGPVEVQSEICCADASVSSTRIRKLLEKGDVKTAAQLLMRTYSFSAPVLHGKALGRKLGIPTINQLFPNKMQIPARGVYATECTVDQKKYRAVTNIGTHPTVDCDAPLNCETFLLDFHGEIYGKEVEVSFLQYLRPEQKFDSIQALCDQIEQDILQAKMI